FRLSPQELTALRAGQRLQFSEVPRVGEQPLPPDVGRGALQTMRDFRFFIQGGRSEVADAKSAPHGLPLTAVPEARGTVYLTMRQSELGQFTLDGGSGFAI